MPTNRWKGWGVLLASLILPGAAWGANNQTKGPGVPGTVNYVEGQVFLGGEQLNANSIGSTTVDPGQMMSTRNGKVEVLLTPGVFLRLGSNSSARMLAAGLANTEMELEEGQAMLEVDEIRPENNLRIREEGMTVRIEKTGLYEFDLDAHVLRVFDGQAEVATMNQDVTVKSKHVLSIGDDETVTVEKFNPKKYPGDELYTWSSLRSAYVAEANVNEASYYEQYGWMPGGPFWWGDGWYWDPWFDAYTFMPWDGIFFSPFGWGFYAPWCVYQAPFYGYGYMYGRGQYYHHFSTDPAKWGPGGHYATGEHYARGTYSGPGSTHEAFHSGGRFFGGSGGFMSARGGGFHGGHGGFGGFNGGGFGGFHGGGFGGGHGGGGGGHGGR